MTILDLVFPKRCISCNYLGAYICLKCQKEIKIIKENICPVCEKPSPYGLTHPGCQTRYSLDGLYSGFVYQGVIKKAIHQLKYRPYVFDLSKILLKLLNKSFKTNPDNLITQILKDKSSIIVPIPLFAKKEKERGFNQSEIVAKLLSKQFKRSMITDLLIRSKLTIPQAKLKMEDRRKNIQGAFKINPDLMIDNSGLNIILVDDIWTTGITLRTCGNLLKRAGFKQVWGLTIAR